LHKDHLGSVDVVTNDTGTVLERDSFDAWGFRRTTDWQAQQPSSYRSTVSRGFTDHEELDDFGLVHMNGRVYDPGIGRFLSADPFVQAPMMTQNFNRYSYVLNNPLSFTDPSGFNFLQDFGSWLNHTLGPTGAQIFIGLSAVICVATQQYWIAPLMYASIGVTAANVVVGVGAGFSSAFVSTSVSGASLGQAFESGLISAGTAALTAGVIGPAFEGIDASTPLGFAEKTLGHGIAGGLINAADAKLQNGSFRDGFIAGFASEAASVGINMVPGKGFESVATRVVLSGAIGGTAAELGGGKFVNGAITAAFLRLYNEEMLQHAWNAGKVGMAQDNPLTLKAMNHADGTSPGDWYLTAGDVDRLKQSGGYEQLTDRMKDVLYGSYAGAADGTYSLNSGKISVTFDKYSDAGYAFGSARFWVSGTVTVLDGKAYWNGRVTMYDWFSFTTPGSMRAQTFTPTWVGMKLQLSGYLHPFNTYGYYNQTVSTYVH
jgi:RHS repeat-associated protein